MSLSRKDRNFPHLNGEGSPDLASEVAAALRREFGDLPATVKRIAQLADAKERTVKNWLAVNNGPSGEHLIALMRHSEQVLEVVLRLSGRYDMLQEIRVESARLRLEETLRSMEELLGDASPRPRSQR